jgi:hypothetical protein
MKQQTEQRMGEVKKLIKDGMKLEDAVEKVWGKPHYKLGGRSRFCEGR